MSGRIFKNTVPITLQEWNKNKNRLLNLIICFGANEVVPVGSAGLVDTMGDIDLAVNHSGGRDGLFKDIKKRFQATKVGNDIVSIAYTLESGNDVQVDLIVGKVAYIQWSRAGSKTPGIKASVRAIFLNVVTRFVSGITFQQPQLALPGIPVEYMRTRYLIDFGEGLKYSEQTRRATNGTGILKSWKTIKSQHVTDDPDTIARMFFGPEASSTNTRTLEGCVDLLKKTSIYEPSTKDGILKEFMTELRELDKKSPGTYGDVELVERIVRSA